MEPVQPTIPKARVPDAASFVEEVVTAFPKDIVRGNAAYGDPDKGCLHRPMKAVVRTHRPKNMIAQNLADQRQRRRPTSRPNLLDEAMATWPTMISLRARPPETRKTTCFALTSPRCLHLRESDRSLYRVIVTGTMAKLMRRRGPILTSRSPS